jgi:hypothetical protein
MAAIKAKIRRDFIEANNDGRVFEFSNGDKHMATIHITESGDLFVWDVRSEVWLSTARFEGRTSCTKSHMVYGAKK